MIDDCFAKYRAHFCIIFMLTLTVIDDFHKSPGFLNFILAFAESLFVVCVLGGIGYLAGGLPIKADTKREYIVRNVLRIALGFIVMLVFYTNIFD